MERRVALVGVLGLHLAVAVAHGAAHELVPVWLSAELNALVALTTFLGPVAGVALAWRGHRLGVPLFTVSLAGAFLLGLVLHFLVENPDHVQAVGAGPWQLSFQATAFAVGLTAALGTVVGARYWLAP